MERKMVADKTQNLQNVFLNNVRKNKVSITIFLINGVKLQGIVTWFDSFCVLLKRNNISQLVYKHAISTIMPAHPITLYSEDGVIEVEEEDNPVMTDNELTRKDDQSSQ